MSAHYRAQIELACDEATAILTDRQTFALPPRPAGQSDSAYHLSVRAVLTALENEAQDAGEVYATLSEASSQWMTLRTSMTGAERTTDNPIYDTFVGETPFPKITADLRIYLRGLRAAKQALVGALTPASGSLHPPTTHSLIHLPKATLPTFSGDCISYKSFWNSFCSGVHEQALPDSLKFTYLKQCLAGPPLTLISSLPVSNESYAAALDLLSKHYDDPEEVARALHQSLRNLPRVRSGETFCGDLRSLIEQLEAICVQMGQQNQSSDTITLQMEVEQRLPRFILDEIFMAKETSAPWSTDKLRDKLRAILKRKEQIQNLLPKPSPPSKPMSNWQDSRHSPPLGSPHTSSLTFHSNAHNPSRTIQPNSQTPFRTCLFCETPEHRSTYCTRYPNPDSRYQRLKILRRCLKCLKAGHSAPQCPDPVACTNCLGTHPRPLCPNPPTRNAPYNAQLSQGSRTPAYPSTTRTERAPAPSNNRFTRPTPPFPRNQPRHSTPPHSSRPPHGGSRDPLPSQATLFNASDPVVESQTNTALNLPFATQPLPVLLKCARVTIFNPDTPTLASQVVVLLDDASSHSYISVQGAQKIGLPLSPCSVRLGVFNNPQPKTVPSNSARFGIKLLNGRSLMVTAHTVDHLTQPIPHIPFSPELFSPGDLPFLPVNVRPTVLLGGDFYYELEPTPIQRLPSGYHLFQTMIGPMVVGRPYSTPANFSRVTNFCMTEVHPTVPPADFFTLEGVGIKDLPQPHPSEADVLQQFKSDIEFVNGRYQIKFPFKAEPPTLPLPSNFGLCWGRLRSVLKSLHKTPPLLIKYNSILMEQLELGIIEPVTNPHCASPPLHYLAHHPVVNVVKNKVRIVYDGSAHTGKELALNECLYPGPILLPDMVGLLFRFRLPPIAIACDIEKAFLQVSVHPTHRDCTRFLWVRNPSLPLSQSNMAIYRFARVSFGLTCSPFLLAATIQHHLAQFPSPLSTEIDQNIYVDNLLLSADRPDEGHTKTREALSLFEKAGMNLREFVSNSPVVIAQIPPGLALKGPKQKFLGIDWCTDSDCLSLTVSIPPPDLILTKRSILSFVASHFDPLGLISPVLLPFKRLLQTIWIDSLNWDDPIPREMADQWNRLVGHWRSGDQISTPRAPSAIPRSQRIYELHAFSDASNSAMCATVYLRISYRSSPTITPFLIFAKTKIKPTHKGSALSIPRLELIAAEMGSRALQFTYSQLKDLPFTPTQYLWIDSAIVLAWLNGGPPAREIFVHNRLKVIRETPHLIVRHLPGSENPADIGTRGVDSLPALQSRPLWWEGPPWLRLPKESWPVNPAIKPFFSEKVEHSNPRADPSPPLMTFLTNEILPPAPVFDLSKFTRLPKTLRIVAFALRFITRTSSNQPQQAPLGRAVTLPEFRSALQTVIKQEQSANPPPDRDNAALALYFDPQGLLRSRGRLEQSGLPFPTMEPIYLPPKSHLTRLIVFETHLTNLHSSPLHTLSIVRKQFWIPRGRRTVDKILAKACVICRRFTSKPFDLPPFPQFPEGRVRPAPPFSATGLDFCGPLQVLPGDQPNATSRTQKQYIVLWVCLVTRAISLDLTPDQSTSSFALAFRRFSARFGAPVTVHCDNAPTFHSFEKFLQPHSTVCWHYRTPGAAWKGGHYERLVSLVKFHLRRTLSSSKHRMSTHAQISTILVEIESVVNSRPITWDSSNSKDPRPLRPADFLRPLNPHLPSPFTVSLEIHSTDSPSFPTSTQTDLSSLWSTLSALTKSFWKKWSVEYLTSLRERHKKLTQNSSRWPVKGELVLVQQEIVPRSLWPMAIILEIKRNESNFPDTAKIRTLSGHITTRSVSHLYPLETTDEVAERGAERPSHNQQIPILPAEIPPPQPTNPPTSGTWRWAPVAPTATALREHCPPLGKFRWALQPPGFHSAPRPPAPDHIPTTSHNNPFPQR